MAGYLEAYGVSEDRLARRNRLIKITVIASLLAMILGLILYSSFKNFQQEDTVKGFLQLLGKQDYQDAYRLWGCTEVHPCRDYAFPRFMEDWGPSGVQPDAASARIGESQACGTGVIVQVNYPIHKPVTLRLYPAPHIIRF